MISKLDFVLGWFVAAGVMLLGLCFMLLSPPEVNMAAPVSRVFDALPPSGAGGLESNAFGQYRQNGTGLDEHLAEIYIETARKILPDFDPDSQSIANGPDQWVYVQLPKLLSADVNPARALLGSGDAAIQSDSFGKMNSAQRDISGGFSRFNDLPPSESAGKPNPGNAGSSWIPPRKIQGAGAP